MLKNILPLFFLTLFCTLARPQYIPFDNYTVQRNGLPSNIVYDIEQDREGYLWFATQAGAVKFDGYVNKLYTLDHGLPDNNVMDIFIDSKNRIWLATLSGGIAMIDGNDVKVFNTDNGLVSNYSEKIFEDRQGNIWFISDGEGISLIKTDGIENYDHENSEIDGRIFSTTVSESGKVWFSTIDKVFYYDGKMHLYENREISHATVSNILEHKDGSMWFATQKKGICHVNHTGTTWFNTTNYLKSDIILSIAMLSSDTIAVTTHFPGGFYLISGNRVVRQWDIPRNYRILQVYFDHSKRIWLTTRDNGIILIDDGKLSLIDKKNNLVNNSIYKIFEDYNGNIWLGTGGGISKYGKVIFHIYNDSYLNDDNNIMSIAGYGNQVYLGTNAGLNILENNRISKKYNNKSGLPFYQQIFSILPVNENTVWMGSYEGLIQKTKDYFTLHADPVFVRNKDNPEFITDLRINGEIIYCASSGGLVSYRDQTFRKIDSEKDVGFWGIELDEKGNIWCATESGLAIYDGTSFHYYDTNHGLPHFYCNDIAIDDAGYGWLATEKGLSRIKLGSDWRIQCKNFSSSNGLKSDIIFSVLVDKKGYIWAGHNLGLDRLNPSDFSITNYGVKEGFLPVETSVGAAVISEGDELWFGTVNGAVKYIPKNDNVQIHPPAIYITGISFYNDTADVYRYADETDQETAITFTFPYKRNNLIFKFVGLHYTIIEKNRYSYILEGYDNDWSEPTNETTTPPYRKIPPGKYTFKVKAANCDGIWTKDPAWVSIYIKPPFWQTWWCYLLEIITVILIFFGILRLRVRKLKHDKEVLTQKVKERTLEIEKNRDQIAFQKKEITDSIEYAEKIQTAALPKKEFIDDLLKEYFILYKPRNIVSGDFYWINKIKQKIIVVAADCTGHGVPGAFMSMLGLSILNEISSQKQSLNAGEFLDMLRLHLTKTLKQTGSDEDAKDGMDMALCIIDSESKTLQYAGAYNPLVFIHKGELILYKADKMPVGYHMGVMSPFTTHQIEYEEGDCIYLFSDGYADQFGGPDGKKFMSAKLRELLHNLCSCPMDEQKIHLNETIENWKGINDQIDDILLMGIRL